MRGKLIEDLKYVKVFEPAQRVTAVTLYNGSQVSVSNNGIDTQPCDEINFIVNAGVFTGPSALDAVVVENTTNTPVGSTLVSGRGSPNDAAATATFTQIVAANDQQIHTGSIKAKEFKRYMWLRTYQAASMTTNYSALAVKGKCDRDPQSNSPVFDLNY